MAKQKYIYIANSATDQVCYKAEDFVGVQVDTNQKLRLYFNPLIDSLQDTTADEKDRIILSCGADEKAAIKSISKAISDPYGSAFLVIADDINSVYLTGSGITAVDSIAMCA
jgi:hypothetical protein